MSPIPTAEARDARGNDPGSVRHYRRLGGEISLRAQSSGWERRSEGEIMDSKVGFKLGYREGKGR